MARRQRKPTLGRWRLWNDLEVRTEVARHSKVTNPGRRVATAFMILIGIGFVLLLLPVSRSEPGFDPLDALFTSTSAVTVTGLSTVDVAEYWSPFGKVVILVLVQLGGFGITAMTSLLALRLSHRLGLGTRLLAQAETGALTSGEVRSVLGRLVTYTAVIEGAVALLLTLRFATHHDYPIGKAIAYGVFHAVTAFNNAGFALFSDNLMGFVSDDAFLMIICAAIILGGIGFPVIYELLHRTRMPETWSLHTRIMVFATPILLLVGMLTFLALEWTNPGSLGPLGFGDKLVNAFNLSVQPRTAGFNTIDYSQLRDSSWLVTDVLMFIGAGSASTGGGIKITTAVILLLVVVSTARGTEDVTGFGRRIKVSAIREALVVTLLFGGVVLAGTLVLVVTSPVQLDHAILEVISASSTVGLSAGVTSTLNIPSQVTLIVIMFLGRVGPATIASALAMRERPVLYQLPADRPIVG